jgi:putative aldouronate transport system substrate-binding protein
MNKRSKRFLCAIIGAAVSASIFAGCTAKKSSTEVETGSNSTSAKDFKYPVDSKEKLTYWVQLNGVVSPSAKTLNETEWAKEMEKQTGIKVEYIHPAQGQEKEQFNLLVASGELPDIVEWGWSGFSGGPDRAIEDEVIIKLNDPIAKYAPNFTKYLKDNPDVAKEIKTDAGSNYYFPFIRGEEILTVFAGPLLRADWLKELNLEVPTTIDEWEKVLRAFKEKKGVPAPLTMQYSGDDHLGRFHPFSGAYGITLGYYLDNGKIKHGAISPEYKEFLTLFNKWYKDGLLDKNYFTTDSKILGSNMLTGKSGAAIGFAGGSIGGWLKAAKDPGYDLVAAPYPTLKKGDKPEFGQKDPKVKGMGAAISKASKNVELAVRLLDFGYSPAGEMINNFGTEGVSYKMENGYPKYTDVIMKNPDKLSISQALGKYARSSYSGVFVQRKEYIEQFYELNQQKDALNTWSNTNMAKHMVPNITPSQAEADELSKIDNDIDTYISEMRTKFIMGTEPLSNYDKYLEQLKKMNIEKAIKIRQDALERYNKR